MAPRSPHTKAALTSSNRTKISHLESDKSSNFIASSSKRCSDFGTQPNNGWITPTHPVAKTLASSLKTSTLILGHFSSERCAPYIFAQRLGAQ